jgi:hypothetical protein
VRVRAGGGRKGLVEGAMIEGMKSVLNRMDQMEVPVGLSRRSLEVRETRVSHVTRRGVLRRGGRDC